MEPVTNMYRQNIKKIQFVIISHARYHSRTLRFNFGTHFDFMLINSRRLLILHRALGSSYMKTYVLIPNSPFCNNRLKRYYPLYIAKVFRRPSWIVKLPPMGFLGIFTMSFNMIFGHILKNSACYLMALVYIEPWLMYTRKWSRRTRS